MGCHCLLLIHVEEEQKLTQHPKAIIHQWKKKRIFKLPFSLLSFEKESKLMLPNQSYLQLFCFFNNIFPNGIFGVSQVREKERRRKRKRERESENENERERERKCVKNCNGKDCEKLK